MDRRFLTQISWGIQRWLSGSGSSLRSYVKLSEGVCAFLGREGSLLPVLLTGVYGPCSARSLAAAQRSGSSAVGGMPVQLPLCLPLYFIC